MIWPVSLFILVAAMIVGAWTWLGAPVAMPPSPIATGEKLFCVSYAPFRGEQNPLSDATRVTAQQIEQDLAQLAPVAGCVRTYSTEHGLDQVPVIARKFGLKVMQGLWLSSNREKSRQQVESTVALANQYRDVISAVIVGNEVLLRGEMAAVDLASTIRGVKERVPVPVTYADVWEFWLRHADLANVVDFITIHILPYWEDDPIVAEKGAAHVDSIRRRVVSVFPNKDVLVGETGWPSAGRMREHAEPSPSAQARLLHEVLNAAKRGNYRVNIIEAYDQPWKRALEGTVGGHWGLYEGATREPKFVWGEAVSDHPHWRLQAGLGIGLAVITFAAGWFAGRGSGSGNAGHWIPVGLLAAVGGGLVGLTLESAMLQTLGPAGWIRSIALVVVALAGPVLAAAAWTRQVSVPSLARLLRGVASPPQDGLTVGLGVLLLVLCAVSLEVALGLTFDPRYRDFPFAPLTAGAFAFFLLAVGRTRQGGGYYVAERVTAIVLVGATLYFTVNEGFSNWQSLWLAGALVLLAVALMRPAARSGAAAPG